MHERHCLERDFKLHLGAWEGDRACGSESCQLWSLRFHCGLHVWFQDAFCDRVETDLRCLDFWMQTCPSSNPSNMCVLRSEFVSCRLI